MSYKGTSWKKHKYVKKVKGRYYYDIDEVIDEKSDSFDRGVEDKVAKLDRKIERDLIKFENKIGTSGNMPDLIMIKVDKPTVNKKPIKDVNEISDTKMTSDIVEKGINFFSNIYDGFKYANSKISDSILDGISYFDKFLEKYW